MSERRRVELKRVFRGTIRPGEELVLRNVRIRASRAKGKGQRISIRVQISESEKRD